jgi:N-methylhydantoinase A
MGYRIGIDVGGTFTDLVLVRPDGSLRLGKAPTTLDDQSVFRDAREASSG